jgi:hypothetical protein
MSLSELKQELAKLSEEQQQEVSAYLEYLLEKRPLNFHETLGSKVSDANPANWISLEELKRRSGS